MNTYKHLLSVVKLESVTNAIKWLERCRKSNRDWQFYNLRHDTKFVYTLSAYDVEEFGQWHGAIKTLDFLYALSAHLKGKVHSKVRYLPIRIDAYGFKKFAHYGGRVRVERTYADQDKFITAVLKRMRPDDKVNLFLCLEVKVEVLAKKTKHLGLLVDSNVPF